MLKTAVVSFLEDLANPGVVQYRVDTDPQCEQSYQNYRERNATLMTLNFLLEEAGYTCIHSNREPYQGTVQVTRLYVES